MVIARSGARFLSSAASTRAALWRASLSGIWWESRNSRAAEGPGTIAASHTTAKIAPSERRIRMPPAPAQQQDSVQHASVQHAEAAATQRARSRQAPPQQHLARGVDEMAQMRLTGGALACKPTWKDCD